LGAYAFATVPDIRVPQKFPHFMLPSVEAAGKDMGIWRISMVLPQILGPTVTGGMISAVKVSFGDPTAYATAFGIGAFWLVISAVLVTRVRVPVPAGNKIRTFLMV
jgi:hypothetical protein